MAFRKFDEESITKLWIELETQLLNTGLTKNEVRLICQNHGFGKTSKVTDSILSYVTRNARNNIYYIGRVTDGKWRLRYKPWDVEEFAKDYCKYLIEGNKKVEKIDPKDETIKSLRKEIDDLNLKLQEQYRIHMDEVQNLNSIVDTYNKKYVNKFGLEFQLEQTVYYMKNNMICEGHIIGINRSPNEKVYILSIYPHTTNKVNNVDEVFMFEAYSTVEQLINYLKTNVLCQNQLQAQKS